MDQKLKNNLILVGVILLVGVGFYYFFSPYQNCLRNEPYSSELRTIEWCGENTDW